MVSKYTILEPNFTLIFMTSNISVGIEIGLFTKLYLTIIPLTVLPRGANDVALSVTVKLVEPEFNGNLWMSENFLK